MSTERKEWLVDHDEALTLIPREAKGRTVHLHVTQMAVVADMRSVEYPASGCVRVTVNAALDFVRDAYYNRNPRRLVRIVAQGGCLFIG